MNMNKKDKKFAQVFIKDFHALIRKHKIHELFIQNSGIYIGRGSEETAEEFVIKYISIGKKDVQFNIENKDVKLKMKP